MAVGTCKAPCSLRARVKIILLSVPNSLPLSGKDLPEPIGQSIVADLTVADELCPGSPKTTLCGQVGLPQRALQERANIARCR